jgi:hypothetical protein
MIWSIITEALIMMEIKHAVHARDFRGKPNFRDHCRSPTIASDNSKKRLR